MNLLNTITEPNDLCAHALEHLVMYKDGVITRYAKDDKNATLVAESPAYPLAGVLALGISANGKVIVAQTVDKTYRIIDGVTNIFELSGNFDVSDTGTMIVLNVAINTIHIVQATTRNVNATLSAKDRVSCGSGTFMVYDDKRSIKMHFGGNIPVTAAFAKSTVFVHHVKSNNYALFHKDGSVTFKGNNYQNRVLQKHRSLGKWVSGIDGEFEWGFMHDYPLSAAKKIRENSTPLDSSIELIYEKAITSKQIGLSANYGCTPTTLYLPTLPMIALDYDLTELVGTSPPATTWAAPYAINDGNVVSKAYGYKSYLSRDKGLTWEHLVPAAPDNYNGGYAFYFKGAPYVLEDKAGSPVSWRKYNDDAMTSFVRLTHPTDPPFTIMARSALNANALITSTNATANANNVYISWAFPTFRTYVLNLNTNVIFTYLGCNIFVGMVTNKTVLIYVPPTQGTPIILKTFVATHQIYHIKGSLVAVETATLSFFTADLQARAEDPNTSLADAIPYADAIEAAYANKTLFFKNSDGVDYPDSTMKWGDSRLAIIGRKNVRVWEFE